MTLDRFHFNLTPMLVIARLTLLETLRNRLPGAVLVLAVLGLGLAAFLEEAAVTETIMVQSAILGMLFRLEAVFLMSVAVIAGSAREFNDRLVEVILALPIPRSTYFLGKLTGYSIVSFCVAMAFGVALLPFVPLEQITLWSLSLAGELILMSVLGLLLVLTLTQVPLALTIAIGFYVLSRSMDALILIATGPFSESSSQSAQGVEMVLTFLAWILPGLDRFTSSEWLVYHSGSWQELGTLFMELSLTFLVVCGAGLFDLYRKNF